MVTGTTLEQSREWYKPVVLSVLVCWYLSSPSAQAELKELCAALARANEGMEQASNTRQR